MVIQQLTDHILGRKHPRKSFSTATRDYTNYPRAKQNEANKLFAFNATISLTFSNRYQQAKKPTDFCEIRRRDLQGFGHRLSGQRSWDPRN